MNCSGSRREANVHSIAQVSDHRSLRGANAKIILIMSASRTVKCRSEVGDCSGLAGKVADEQRCTNYAGMIGLGCEDAGSPIKDSLICDQRSGAVISRRLASNM